MPRIERSTAQLQQENYSLKKDLALRFIIDHLEDRQIVFEEDNETQHSHRKEVTNFEDVRFNDGRFVVDVFLMNEGSAYKRDFLGVTVADKSGVLGERMIDSKEVFYSIGGLDEVPVTKPELVAFIKQVYQGDESFWQRKIRVA